MMKMQRKLNQFTISNLNKITFNENRDKKMAGDTAAAAAVF